MLHLTVLHFLATDTTDHPDIGFQRTLIHLTFKGTTHGFRKYLGPDVPHKNIQRSLPPAPSGILQAIGKKLELNFQNGLLKRVFIHNWVKEDFCGIIHIKYLPHSVEHLELQGCQQQFEINARTFPRSATLINLKYNRLFGSMDLRSLPKKLIALDVAINNLSGRLSFIDLPQTIEGISLNYNDMLGEPNSFLWAFTEIATQH